MKTKSIKIMIACLLSFLANLNAQVTYLSGTLGGNNCTSTAGTGGANNTNIGCGAGNGTTGNQCTFLGHQAGTNNIALSENLGVGYQALFLNAAPAPGYATWNVAVGNKALYNTNSSTSSPLDGAYNTAVGHSAGNGNTTGNDNTAIG